MKKLLISFALLLLLIVLGYTFREKRRPALIEENPIIVERGDIIVRATETGALVPMNAVEIKSEQSGEVKKFFVQAGSRVTAGALLATLQPESSQVQRVAEARARVSQGQLGWEDAQREDARMNELFAKGFISQKELEGAIKQAENAKIQYELAKKQLLLTLGGDKTLYESVLKMDLAMDAIDNFSVFSPISGTVLEVNVSEGQIVSSGMSTVTGGTTLMRISDLSRMWIKTKINEVSIGQIQEGQKSDIRLDAIPNHLYQGTVVKISPKGEKIDNVITYEVTIEIMNPDQRLMPSMTANVDIITAVERNVLTLPLIALTKSNGSDAVLLPTISGEKKYQQVEVGLKNETIAVITKGLSEGDKVLLPHKEASSHQRD
ncbi:MAG: efflux RND transporter periplasmic adaptor subunit [Nitrospirae bacterium]|nr:efflux RND transporter periplasmic adaptor subunit [Candidatus Troglogloeales bacterium]MBI3598375.1 efflux RND transporter periplasmic adaptor subunit [Candidatus Troglogloeales bacterium]